MTIYYIQHFKNEEYPKKESYNFLFPTPLISSFFISFSLGAGTLLLCSCFKGSMHTKSLLTTIFKLTIQTHQDKFDAVGSITWLAPDTGENCCWGCIGCCPGGLGGGW